MSLSSFLEVKAQPYISLDKMKEIVSPRSKRTKETCTKKKKKKSKVPFGAKFFFTILNMTNDVFPNDSNTQ